MSNLVSHGYIPKDDCRAAETFLFCANFQLILKNFDRILKNEKYFFCEFGDAFLSMPYIGPDGPISIGILLMLWQRGDLIEVCPECGGDVYIRGAGGSPLSGTHTYWGSCVKCRKNKVFHGESGFASIWNPIRELLKKYPNKTVIKEGKRKYFSWRDGLAGETTPDEIIKERVQAVELETLINELKKGVRG